MKKVKTKKINHYYRPLTLGLMAMMFSNTLFVTNTNLVNAKSISSLTTIKSKKSHMPTKKTNNLRSIDRLAISPIDAASDRQAGADAFFNDLTYDQGELNDANYIDNLPDDFGAQDFNAGNGYINGTLDFKAGYNEALAAFKAGVKNAYDTALNLVYRPHRSVTDSDFPTNIKSDIQIKAYLEGYENRANGQSASLGLSFSGTAVSLKTLMTSQSTYLLYATNPLPTQEVINGWVSIGEGDFGKNLTDKFYELIYHAEMSGIGNEMRYEINTGKVPTAGQYIPGYSKDEEFNCVYHDLSSGTDEVTHLGQQWYQHGQDHAAVRSNGVIFSKVEDALKNGVAIEKPNRSDGSFRGILTDPNLIAEYDYWTNIGYNAGENAIKNWNDLAQTPIENQKTLADMAHKAASSTPGSSDNDLTPGYTGSEGTDDPEQGVQVYQDIYQLLAKNAQTEINAQRTDVDHLVDQTFTLNQSDGKDLKGTPPSESKNQDLSTSAPGLKDYFNQMATNTYKEESVRAKSAFNAGQAYTHAHFDTMKGVADLAGDGTYTVEDDKTYTKDSYQTGYDYEKSKVVKVDASSVEAFDDQLIQADLGDRWAWVNTDLTAKDLDVDETFKSGNVTFVLANTDGIGKVFGTQSTTPKYLWSKSEIDGNGKFVFKYVSRQEQAPKSTLSGNTLTANLDLTSLTSTINDKAIKNFDLAHIVADLPSGMTIDANGHITWNIPDLNSEMNSQGQVDKQFVMTDTSGNQITVHLVSAKQVDVNIHYVDHHDNQIKDSITLPGAVGDILHLTDDQRPTRIDDLTNSNRFYALDANQPDSYTVLDQADNTLTLYYTAHTQYTITPVDPDGNPIKGSKPITGEFLDDNNPTVDSPTISGYEPRNKNVTIPIEGGNVNVIYDQFDQNSYLPDAGGKKALLLGLLSSSMVMVGLLITRLLKRKHN